MAVHEIGEIGIPYTYISDQCYTCKHLMDAPVFMGKPKKAYLDFEFNNSGLTAV